MSVPGSARSAPSDLVRPDPLLEDDGRARYRLTYCVLLVTRRRRPLFADPAVRARCEALLRASAEAAGCRVVCCEVWPAEATVHVEAPPGLSPAELVRRLREGAGGPLAAEVEAVRQVGGAFARRHVVTTAPVAETACGEG